MQYNTGSNKGNVIADDLNDTLTSLKEGVKAGRPDWRQFFSLLRQLHTSSNISVFHAGPYGLARELRLMCRSYSDLDTKLLWKGSKF